MVQNNKGKVTTMTKIKALADQYRKEGYQIGYGFGNHPIQKVRIYDDNTKRWISVVVSMDRDMVLFGIVA